MKSKIEMEGTCLRCDTKTLWTAVEGWAFHTYTKHWRCTICNCVTQPHLYLPVGMVEKIQRFETQRRSVVLEIEL